MTTATVAYLVAWVTALAISSLMVVRRPADFEFTNRDWWRRQSELWKLVTFVVATAGVAAAAPYSGDPTWDLFDSLLISLVVFISAPWAVGAFYRAALGRAPRFTMLPALCAFLLPCWTYDVYILARDGAYPDAWASNIVLSGIICAAAGCFWNLSRVAGETSALSFKHERWPAPVATGFRAIAVPALAFMAVPTIGVGAFVAAWLFDW